MNEEIKIRQNGALATKNGAPFSSELSELCNSSPAKALAALDASPTGLTEEQVEERRERYGLNEVSHESPRAGTSSSSTRS